MDLTAAAIAQAFNTANDKVTWTARPNSRPDAGLDLVHFSSNTGLVTLVYNTMNQRMEVRFNKFQAAWGDYIKAICRSLVAVLTTLKRAGLPFEAPASFDTIRVIVEPTDDQAVFVTWEPVPAS